MKAAPDIAVPARTLPHVLSRMAPVILLVLATLVEAAPARAERYVATSARETLAKSPPVRRTPAHVERSAGSTRETLNDREKPRLPTSRAVPLRWRYHASCGWQPGPTCAPPGLAVRMGNGTRGPAAQQVRPPKSHDDGAGESSNPREAHSKGPAASESEHASGADDRIDDEVEQERRELYTLSRSIRPEGTAAGERTTSHTTWQASWKNGVSGSKAVCAVSREIRGSPCGRESFDVRITNVCKEPIRVSHCLERRRGDLDCGMTLQLQPGQTVGGAYTCKGTGRWRAVACGLGEKCRAYEGDAVLSKKSSAVELSDCVERELTKMASEFFRRTGRRMTVTDGTRTPREQAMRIHQKLEAREPLGYQEGALAERLAAVWRSLTPEQRRSRGVDALQSEIEKQVADGKFVSRHLRSSAADVRIERLGDEHTLAALAKHFGIEVHAEPFAAGGPHLHLNVTACE